MNKVGDEGGYGDHDACECIMNIIIGMYYDVVLKLWSRWWFQWWYTMISMMIYDDENDSYVWW
jgi:hypothetical protein